MPKPLLVVLVKLCDFLRLLRLSRIGTTLLFATCALLLQPTSIWSQEPQQAVIKQIMADWKARRTLMKAVRYRLTGTRTWPRDRFNSITSPPTTANPPQDTKGSLHRSLLLDFPTNRHRVEWDDEHYDYMSKSLYRIRDHQVCDGTVCYSHILENSYPGLGAGRAKKHVDMIISRGRMPLGVFDYTYLPLFFGHGIVTYDSEVRVRPGVLTPPLREQDFTLSGFGTHEGRKCAVLRAVQTRSGQYEFWVDPARMSAVVKVVWNPGSAALNSTTTIDYHQTPTGWFPKGWKTSHVEDETVVLTEEMAVEVVSVNPVISPADFREDPTRGMYVEDVTYSELATGALDSVSNFYRIESDGTRTPLNEKLVPIGGPRARLRPSEIKP